jgi:hypothetical protein
MADGRHFTPRIRREPTPWRLMNVKIPAHQSDAIARLARQFGASKTEIVLVLLKAGLEAVDRLRRRGALRRS